jgi:hypothetical protein
MHLEDLEAWFQRAAEPWGAPLRAVPARLPGFRLVWNFYSETRAGGAANVERAGGSTLHGLALLVGPSVFQGIDKKEGYPVVYGRELCAIELSNGQSVDAWVYTVQPHRTRDAFVPPTRHYKSLLIVGARAHRLPAFYIDELEGIQTAD